MATLESASFPLIIRRNPADPTDVVNDLILAGRMKSVRLADFIGQKSGQIRYVIRDALRIQAQVDAWRAVAAWSPSMKSGEMFYKNDMRKKRLASVVLSLDPWRYQHIYQIRPMDWDVTSLVNTLSGAGKKREAEDAMNLDAGKHGADNAAILEKYAGTSAQNWIWLKQLHQNLEEAGERGDNLENVVDIMRRAHGRFGAAEMAGFTALREPELKALILRLAAEKGSASSIWEAMKAVGSACHERGGGVCEVRGGERVPDAPRRQIKWEKGGDPHSAPPDGTEEVSHAYVDDDLWIIGKRGDDYFVMFQRPAEDALVWAGDRWRYERETWQRGYTRETRVTPPALFSSIRAAQSAAERLPDPRPMSHENPRKLRRNPDGGPRSDIGCADEVVIDSEGRSYPIIYRVVEAALDGSTVVTSHNPQTFEWQTGAPLRYPEEFQTRDLGSAAESTKIERIAKNLEPLRLLGKHMDPTLGAPVVWPHGGRLYVLGGNGRAMAFLRAPEHAYQAYLKLARCRWDCFPPGAAPHGSRWMLVREVQDISKEQAIQLAAASQKSTAATENKIAEAIGLVRALGLEAAEMPLFRFNGPMTPENVEEMRRPTINAEGFREESAGGRFFEYVRKRLDPTKQSKVAQDLQEAARYMEAAVIGLLPEAAQKPSLYEDSRSQDALLGAAPAIISTHSWELHGKLLPGYDLWPALRDAVPLFETIRRKKPLDIRKQMDMEREQVGIQGGKRISDAPPLAWALALALRAAAGTSQPEVRVAELIRPYYEVLQTACYKPEEDTGQTGMFGRMRAVVADPCEGKRKPAGDLFADSLRDSGVSGADAFYKNYYQIVHGEVPVGAARTLFNRGPARKLSDLLTVAHVYARHGDAPAIEWQRPLDTENAHEFRSLNPDFYRWALHKYPAERGWAGGVDALLGGMLAALPSVLQTRLVNLPARQHPLVIAALPSVLTLHQAAQRGEVAAAMDPGRNFPETVLKAATVKEAVQAMRDYTDKARRSDPRQAALWNRGRARGRSKAR